jgi:hypothetical protein
MTSGKYRRYTREEGEIGHGIYENLVSFFIATPAPMRLAKELVSCFPIPLTTDFNMAAVLPREATFS